MAHQPMLEVLAYLRANGFKTFIVSGGGIEFMRPWTETVYGIPPEQVIGNSVKRKFEVRDGKPVLVRVPELNFVDDNAGKPVGVNQHIGRRPSPRSATPMATCQCSSGSPPAPARASASTFTTRTPRANGLTTASRRLAASTKVLMKRTRKAGRS
jgi:hypothetical protein